MTTKRYPESKNLSRSRKVRRTRPFPDHYTAAQPASTSEEYPVDVLIDDLPEIASRRRRLSKMVKEIQRQARDETAFIRLMDAKFEYTSRREQLYFNVGYQRGQLAGLAGSCGVSSQVDANVRRFVHQLCLAVASAKLPKPKMAAALLDVARAVVLASRADGLDGSPIPGGHRTE
jgi:hypothetical protein